MSDPGSQWTPDLLHQHMIAMLDGQERRFNERIESLTKSIELSLHAAEKAILKAENATERRLEGLNELRAVTEDRAKEFIPRAVAEALTQRLGERIDALAERYAERIDELQSRLDRLEGTRTGLSTGWQVLLAAIGGIGVITMIVYTLAR